MRNQETNSRGTPTALTGLSASVLQMRQSSHCRLQLRKEIERRLKRTRTNVRTRFSVSSLMEQKNKRSTHSR